MTVIDFNYETEPGARPLPGCGGPPVERRVCGSAGTKPTRRPARRTPTYPRRHATARRQPGRTRPRGRRTTPSAARAVHLAGVELGDHSTPSRPAGPKAWRGNRFGERGVQRRDVDSSTPVADAALVEVPVGKEAELQRRDRALDRQSTTFTTTRPPSKRSNAVQAAHREVVEREHRSRPSPPRSGPRSPPAGEPPRSPRRARRTAGPSVGEVTASRRVPRCRPRPR